MSGLNNKIIQSMDAKFNWPIITDELRNIVLSQMDTSLSIYNRSGIFKEFEEKFRQYHSSKYALLFNSGTSAIHGMLEGLDLNPEDEIICPVYTFFATCSPATYLGYKLVFCDVDNNGNIDPLEIEKLITPRTKVILITHMWGNPCNMDAIMGIINGNDLILLEDCSHSHGGEYRGKKLGTFGKAAAWSLQGQKIITGGEGGVMITSDNEIYYRANLLGHYNKRCRDEIPKDSDLYQFATTGFGLKLRSHPLAIAIANNQMNYLDLWINQKNVFAQKFIKALDTVPFLTFLDTTGSKPSYYGLVMKFHDELSNGISREMFVEALHEIGLIEVDIPNSTSPLDKLPFFNHPEKSSKRLGSKLNAPSLDKDYPEAYKFYNQIIKIPVWVRQEDEKIINLYIEGFKSIANKIINSKSNKDVRTRNFEPVSNR